MVRPGASSRDRAAAQESEADRRCRQALLTRGLSAEGSGAECAARLTAAGLGGVPRACIGQRVLVPGHGPATLVSCKGKKLRVEYADGSRYNLGAAVYEAALDAEAEPDRRCRQALLTRGLSAEGSGAECAARLTAAGLGGVPRACIGQRVLVPGHGPATLVSCKGKKLRVEYADGSRYNLGAAAYEAALENAESLGRHQECMQDLVRRRRAVQRARRPSVDYNAQLPPDVHAAVEQLRVLAADRAAANGPNWAANLEVLAAATDELLDPVRKASTEHSAALAALRSAVTV